MRHLIIRFIYIALAALSVVSCNTTERGVGYIHIDLVSDVDASVELSPVTKAIIEASDDYIVEIGGETYRYGDIKSTGVELLAGTYSVQAYNSSVSEAESGKGGIRFASETQQVEVQVGQTASVSLQCKMVNSRFTFSYDEAFVAEFDPDKTTLEVSNSPDFSGRTVTLDGVSDEVYFTAGESIYVRVTTSKRGYTSTHSLVIGPYTAQAATSHNISIKYAAPIFELGSRVAHTYSGGVLTGTAVTLDVSSFSGISADKFASWEASLISGGSTIRSYTSTSFPVAGSSYTMAVEGGLIYLPVNTGATLSVSVTLKTGEVLDFTPDNNTITVAESPAFTVSINAETSYSRYKAGQSSANNAGTGDKVMNIGATISISNDVLSQMNASLKFTYDGLSMLGNVDNNKYKSISSANVPAETLENNTGLFNSQSREIISQAWGTHIVEASVIFDGVTKSLTQACHVTGIPQYISKMNKNENGWTGKCDNLLYGVSMDAAEDYILSPAYYVPSEIYIKVVFSASRYLGNRKGYLYISTGSTPGAFGTYLYIDNNTLGVTGSPQDHSEYTVGNLSMNSTVNQVYLYNSAGKRQIGYLNVLYNL